MQVFSILHVTITTTNITLHFLNSAQSLLLRNYQGNGFHGGFSTDWWVLRSASIFPKTVLMNSSPSSPPLECRKVASGFW